MRQDALGGWHDVEGWQGALDKESSKGWWVAAQDYGKGPFRWAVYEGQGGKRLAASESFYLPSSHGQVVRVEISLAPAVGLSTILLLLRTCKSPLPILPFFTS